jgi:hypothetical protein
VAVILALDAEAKADGQCNKNPEGELDVGVERQV